MEDEKRTTVKEQAALARICDVALRHGGLQTYNDVTLILKNFLAEKFVHPTETKKDISEKE